MVSSGSKVGGRGFGKRGELTQALYAHMNKKKVENRSKCPQNQKPQKLRLLFKKN
jgi:hypothetical protein